MKVNIVDTTLRDGEQKAGIAFNIETKVKIAEMLSDMGIYQLEVGVPAMGGSEKLSIEKIAALGLKSKISSFNRMNINDVNHSLDCGVDIIHISVPSSDIQIEAKLGKDRLWVKSNMERVIDYAMEKGKEVTVGLEDASRADSKFLIELCSILQKLGVKRVRYADTVGILYPRRIYNEVKRIKEAVNLQIETHVHNDFGMAAANSIAAAEAGAEYVDCTIKGIGERAGNCDLIKFLRAYCKFSGEASDTLNFYKLENIEKGIWKVICQNNR